MSKVKKWVLDIETGGGLLPTVTKLTIAHLRAVDSKKGKLFTNGLELVSALHGIFKKGGIVICHNAQYDKGV